MLPIHNAVNECKILVVIITVMYNRIHVASTTVLGYRVYTMRIISMQAMSKCTTVTNYYKKFHFKLPTVKMK